MRRSALRRLLFRTFLWTAGIVYVAGAAGTLDAQENRPIQAKAADQKWVELLMRVRARAISTLDHQPNYTCTETIDRSHRSKSAHKLQLLDTIRLEVALVDGKETFGWPGATKFEDTDLRHFIKEGAIGNGSFAMHARNVFHGGAIRFSDGGASSAGGRRWVRFVFEVPVERSGYSLKHGEQEAIVPYHGSFDADPETLDLERIEVIADEIPAKLAMRRAVSVVKYARTKIGTSEFLLPSESEMTLVELDGSESRNQLRFAGCRQFAGESVLRFDDPTASPDTPVEIAEIVLPAGVGVTLALLDDIDLAKAAIGDPVRARLQNDLKSKGRLLIAKDAIATGHLTRIERNSEAVMVGLTFDELQGGGVRAQPRMKLDAMSSDYIAPRFRYLLSPTQPGEGIFPLRFGHGKLNRGLLMNWSTQN